MKFMTVALKVGFGIAILGASLAAAVIIEESGFFRRVLDGLELALITAPFLLIPFIAAGIIGSLLARSGRNRSAQVIFWVTTGLLTALYFVAFFGAQDSANKGGWTAASISVGILPIVAVPLLLIAAIAAGLCWIFTRKAARAG